MHWGNSITTSATITNLKGEIDLTKDYLNKALTVFELQNDDKYAQLLQNKINELTTKDTD